MQNINASALCPALIDEVTQWAAQKLAEARFPPEPEPEPVFDWASHAALFGPAFDALPVPEVLFEEQGFVVVHWGLVHCVLLPGSDVVIHDNRPDSESPSYLFEDRYDEGIAKLVTLLCDS